MRLVGLGHPAVAPRLSLVEGEDDWATCWAIGFANAAAVSVAIRRRMCIMKRNSQAGLDLWII